MGANNARFRERRRGYLRRMRGEKQGVSPVVATLILILIAVAAAAALYLWLVAWQGGVTGSIGSPGAQYTLSIGGSTSEYPFASLAAAQFEQNNTDVAVSVNEGGSGAGMAAVCSGQINIGEAATYYGTGLSSTPATLQTEYGCPSTVAVEVVAYDGVDPIVQAANPHGLQGLAWDTAQAVFVAASTSTPTAATNLHLAGAYTFGNGLATAAEVPVPAYAGAAPGFAWDQIPACASEAATATCAGVAFQLSAGVSGGSAIPGTETPCTGFASDLCSAPASTTTCGWTVCAGGTTSAPATDEIVISARSDVAGATQSFIARDLAVGATGGTPLGLGFTGCSGDNQWDGCNIAFPGADLHTGDQGVISAVAGTPDAIGYASDGLVQAGGSGVTPIAFQGYGQSVVVALANGAAIKAIAAGIADDETNSATFATSQAYVGWRPFLNVETAPPTGEALRYLQFVMDPANNQNIATESHEISVYASGLAGVVPVTPIP